MEKELLNTFDKELLLKDLCARLPYGVKVESVFINTDTKKRKSCGIEVFDATCILMIRDGFGEFKPYLFPLSSITEGQKNQISQLLLDAKIEFPPYEEDYANLLVSSIKQSNALINYCLANHFDINGLIEEGLAIDATGLNIY